MMRCAGLIWALFFVICLELGYPTLNRYDPSYRNPDAGEYHAMVIHGGSAATRHFQHRVLIPYLAHLVYAVANGRLRSWDPGYVALLVVNSLFVSATALLIFLIAFKLFLDTKIAFVAAALYLLNFAVSNLFLAGLVDSGESFFMIALALALLCERAGILPLLGVLGSLTKETFLPFSIIFGFTWLVVTRSLRRSFVWLLASAVAGLAAITLALSLTDGKALMPWSYAASLHDAGEPKLRVAIAAINDRSFWYVFIYLLPLGLIRIRRLPEAWVLASLTTCVVAFVLAIYHNDAADAGGAFTRPAFTAIGPLLCCSSALLLDRRASRPVGA